MSLFVAQLSGSICTSLGRETSSFPKLFPNYTSETKTCPLKSGLGAEISVNGMWIAWHFGPFLSDTTIRNNVLILHSFVEKINAGIVVGIFPPPQEGQGEKRGLVCQ